MYHNICTFLFHTFCTFIIITLYLNPQNEKFLRFEVDGQVYYMSGLNDEETMKVYERLEQN